jgi:excinuclease ABC subunit B
MQGGVINITPVSGTADTIRYSYQTKNWVRPATGADKDAFSLDTDTPLIPDHLLKLGLIWRWKHAIGTDYAEDLSTYFQERKVRCRWLHSELDAFERVELLRDLRVGKFDVLVGVNLLREGLDLPEVSLVAILDADKEGFLRSETSLMQTIGRSARNVDARVILYADTVTESMQQALDETRRRRALQEAYNREHGITPETIRKEIRAGIEAESASRAVAFEAVGAGDDSRRRAAEVVEQLEADMMQAAAELDFERAARIRDEIAALRDGKPRGARSAGPRGRKGRGGGGGRIPKPRSI